MFPLSGISTTLPLSASRAPAELLTPEARPLPPGMDVSLPLGSGLEIGSSPPAGESFASVLGRMVGEVNARQGVAADALNALQSGQNVSLHQAVIAMEEASVSFQLMVEVRNKLLESYQELMRMQI